MILQEVGNSEREVLHFLNEATTAFRDKCAQSPAEMDLFNQYLDTVRRQLIFRDTVPILQKQVFLALPRYGDVSGEAWMQAFMCAGAGSPFGVVIGHATGSATPSTFNICWGDCWNADKQFDYFCMLHSDVAPLDTNWLSTLIQEMEEGNYDVMHALIAIKDNRGLTSTAVSLAEEKYQWHRVRRVTATEVQSLPPTFDAATYLDHVGYDGWDRICREASERDGLNYPQKDGKVDIEWLRNYVAMCNNTGCMLVKLSPKMKRFHGFRFQNRMVAVETETKDGEIKAKVTPTADPNWSGNGALVNQFVPEDWDFGRWCKCQGFRVGATSKVKVQHFGRAWFGTNDAWGDYQHDKHFFAE